MGNSFESKLLLHVPISKNKWPLVIFLVDFLDSGAIAMSGIPGAFPNLPSVNQNGVDCN